MEKIIIKCFRPASCDISTRMILSLSYSSLSERIAGTANAGAVGAGKPSRHSPARPMPTTRKLPGSMA
jgi:hypothetical protein